MARNLLSKLHRVSALLDSMTIPQRFLLSSQELLELAQSLAGEILVKASGSNGRGEFQKRFDELGKLDR